MDEEINDDDLLCIEICVDQVPEMNFLINSGILLLKQKAKKDMEILDKKAISLGEYLMKSFSKEYNRVSKTKKKILVEEEAA